MGREQLLALALVACASLSAASLVGCKSKPEKICANLASLMAQDSPDKKLTAEDKSRCVADIQRELDLCENAETIASCYAEAKTLDAVATCESKCQKKPKGSASAAPTSARRQSGDPTPSPREPGDPTPSPREPGDPSFE